MWHMARSSVSLLAERSQARRWLTETALFRTLRLSGTRLLNTTGWDELGDVLADTLSRLEVPSCFIALTDGGPTHRGIVLVRGRDVQRHFTGHFSAQRLLPEELEQPARRVTWLLKPLVLQNQRLGYVVFETGPLEGRVYAALRDYLSAAIAGLRNVAAEVTPLEARAPTLPVRIFADS
jgi:hypothetical protein